MEQRLPLLTPVAAAPLPVRLVGRIVDWTVITIGAVMATMVFIGECFIIAEVGPSDLDTALRVFEWVAKLNTPDMIYSTKSPRTALPRRPRISNMNTMIATISTDCTIAISRPTTALPWLLRTLRTAA